MATKKIRVYELARELGVENQVVLDLSDELKMGVKSHSSSIDDPSADRIRRLADSRGLRGEPIVDEPKPAAKAKKAEQKTVKSAEPAPAPEPKPEPAAPVVEAPVVAPVAEPVVADGVVRVGRNEPGRGAWLCDDSGCFDLAVRRRALERALRTTLTEADVSRLRVRLYGE